MLLQILNIVTNPKCCCYLFLFPLASLFRFRLQFWFWFRPISVPILESYFIKLFDADLQCEFIRTFNQNSNFRTMWHFFEKYWCNLWPKKSTSSNTEFCNKSAGKFKFLISWVKKKSYRPRYTRAFFMRLPSIWLYFSSIITGWISPQVILKLLEFSEFSSEYRCKRNHEI